MSQHSLDLLKVSEAEMILLWAEESFGQGCRLIAKQLAILAKSKLNEGGCEVSIKQDCLFKCFSLFSITRKYPWRRRQGVCN
jgi:hypothetical protein